MHQNTLSAVGEACSVWTDQVHVVFDENAVAELLVC